MIEHEPMWPTAFHIAMVDSVEAHISMPPDTPDDAKLGRLRLVRDLLTGAIADLERSGSWSELKLGERCQSTLSGMQCELVAGHGKYHKHDAAGWEGDGADQN